MKVTGFTFIRNAILYDYPIVEAIKSILPVCDEIIVVVGKSDDNTLELIKRIDPIKVKIIESVWDDSLRERGQVLAEETNKAFQAIGEDSDWCFYIQGDEVIHENDYDCIRSAMEKHVDMPQVEGLLFKYKHFWGSYDYVGESVSWYRREIRIVKNNKDIYSYKDAQGFRKKPNKKLKVKLIDAHIYHYGWVKDPGKMQEKQKTFHKLWHSDNWVDKNISKADEFDYSSINILGKFEGTHPNVMSERIRNKNWNFDYDISFNERSIKEKIKNFIEKYTGKRIGEYQNYILI